MALVSDTMRFRKQSCKTIWARLAKLVPTCMCHFVSAPLYHESLTPDWPSHHISAMPKKSSLAHQTKMEKNVCQAYHGFPYFDGGGWNRQSVFSMRANTGRHNNPSSAVCASLYSEVKLRYVSYFSRLHGCCCRSRMSCSCVDAWLRYAPFPGPIRYQLHLPSHIVASTILNHPDRAYNLAVNCFGVYGDTSHFTVWLNNNTIAEGAADFSAVHGQLCQGRDCWDHTPSIWSGRTTGDQDYRQRHGAQEGCHVKIRWSAGPRSPGATRLHFTFACTCGCLNVGQERSSGKAIYSNSVTLKSISSNRQPRKLRDSRGGGSVDILCILQRQGPSRTLGHILSDLHSG